MKLAPGSYKAFMRTVTAGPNVAEKLFDLGDLEIKKGQSSFVKKRVY
jgi:hypothetical protein